MSRDLDEKLRQPEGWTVAALELRLAGDIEAADAIVEKYGRKIPELTSASRGSANHWPALVALGLLEDEREWTAAALRYIAGQLDADAHGLGHREILSVIYPWPVPLFAAVYRHVSGRELRKAIRELIAAWACVYALPSISRRPGHVEIVAPGQRSVPWRPEIRDAVLAEMLWPGTIQAGQARAQWPLRLMIHARGAGYFARGLARLLREHVLGEGRPERILRVLERVATVPVHREPVVIERWEDGLVSTMDSSLSNSTAPVLLVAHAAGRRRAAVAHPAEFRGHGGRLVGRPRLEIGARSGRVVFAGAVLAAGSEPETLASPWIPLPSGRVLWRVEV